MATITKPEAPSTPVFSTVADLLDRLGDVSPARIRMVPTPGMATEADVLATHAKEKRLFELVDGVLVEKTIGYEESRFATWLVSFICRYLERHDLGEVTGADGMMRLFPGMVRIPDVAFVSWERFPKSMEPIPDLVPDLAVEVLSVSNSPREMSRKLRDYFQAGVRLVWYVDPRKRTVRVYTSPRRSVVLRENATLDGGDVLPGFRLAIREWFEIAERQGPREAR